MVIQAILIPDQRYEPGNMPILLEHQGVGDGQPSRLDLSSFCSENLLVEKGMAHPRSPIPHIEELVDVLIGNGSDQETTSPKSSPSGRSSWSMVQVLASLSGRHRWNLDACRKRSPSSWS